MYSLGSHSEIPLYRQADRLYSFLSIPCNKWKISFIISSILQWLHIHSDEYSACLVRRVKSNFTDSVYCQFTMVISWHVACRVRRGHALFGSVHSVELCCKGAEGSSKVAVFFFCRFNNWIQKSSPISWSCTTHPPTAWLPWEPSWSNWYCCLLYICYLLCTTFQMIHFTLEPSFTVLYVKLWKHLWVLAHLCVDLVHIKWKEHRFKSFLFQLPAAQNKPPGRWVVIIHDSGVLLLMCQRRAVSKTGAPWPNSSQDESMINQRGCSPHLFHLHII